MIPDTGTYLLLGLAVVLVIFSAMIGSMVLRLLNARKDLAALRALEEEA